MGVGVSVGSVYPGLKVKVNGCYGYYTVRYGGTGGAVGVGSWCV